VAERRYIDIPGSGSLRVTTRRDVREAQRSSDALATRSSLSLEQWVQMFQYNGANYPFGFQGSMTLGSDQEEPVPTFEGYVQGAYRANGVVFACMAARYLLFSEARFMYRQRRSGRPGDLFFNRDLEILERPWPNATTGDLLSRAITDVDIGGNFYARRVGDKLHRLRPDWVTIVLGSDSDPSDEEPALASDAEVIGYVYDPPNRQRDPEIFLPEQICHFAPTPDPLARFRGMSWLVPVIREIMGDNAATQHKLRFFEKGATPNIAVTTDPSVTGQAFQDFVALFKEHHGDLVDAYRTIFLGGGASIDVVGANMQEVDFKQVQGAGETRICAAARVPPIIVGVSEGLDSATYSNYGQARRAYADLTMRPLWRNMCSSLSSIIDVPGDAELWYDDRDIPFLQEDMADLATIQQVQASAIKTLVDAGYDPNSAVEAILADDLGRLDHSGLVSVQLLPPGQSTNGSSAMEPEKEMNPE
jgi:phage portal protein BeeE